MATAQPSISKKDSTRLQGASPEFDSNTVLEEITRNAQHATGASGAALVLTDGGVMSCRSCSGDLGPPVGTRLNTNTGFTATCVQTAKVVRCDDTETDPRVDGSSCIDLGIRSILAVPVFNHRNVAGVLEVLSDERKKFTDRHATALELLARLVETLLSYGSRSDVSLDTLSPEAKLQPKDSAKADKDQAMLTCLSCRRSNPRDSQFCNRCGMVLFGFLGRQDTDRQAVLPTSPQSSGDESLKEICKIISGDAGTATWSEISERLLADQRSVPAQKKPHPAATIQTAKPTEGATNPTKRPGSGLAAPEGANGIKARLGAVRRSLWL